MSEIKKHCVRRKKPPKRNKFKIHSHFNPAGDQPNAIEELVGGLKSGIQDQMLMGVTGSGKTFTMAHVIEKTQRPALIMAPNKTLAAQLYGEMREFFPNNAVEYFVSYYDYYQPEAYVAKTDTYIEKDASINQQIDRMRHAATRALLERGDVIVVASVSCIYGIGDVETYNQMVIELNVGKIIDPLVLAKDLVALQYKRNDIDFSRGNFKVQGDILEIFPVHQEDRAWRISFFGDEIEKIIEFDPLTKEKKDDLQFIKVFANSHYVTPRPTIAQAIPKIRTELKSQVAIFEKQQKLIEAQRIAERTKFDLEMLETTGFCSGIENYSRYLTGRAPGSHPPTLFEYLPEDAILIMDESHVSVSQVGAMYKGDASRKSSLSLHGFRLPSCVDNRPLKQTEWDNMRPQTIFVSATPGNWEMDKTQGVFTEQIVRPTGLLDPACEIRPTKNQVDDVMAECAIVAKNGGRVLITTLTKKNAENLSEYMSDAGLKVRYLHSDVDTLERIEIIRDLRLGTFDILIGINLLREGLDIPECSLVAILDADKEGFLRSKTSLVQTIGRAARNIDGRVVLYADKMTGSLKYALDETARRRERQHKHNVENNITPEGIKKMVGDLLANAFSKTASTKSKMSGELTEKLQQTALKQYILMLRDAMKQSAKNLEFESASEYRDEVIALEIYDMNLPLSSVPADVKIAQRLFR